MNVSELIMVLVEYLAEKNDGKVMTTDVNGYAKDFEIKDIRKWNNNCLIELKGDK